MLILPLHRRLSRTTFPFVTAALVLVNVVVFAFAQTGDVPRAQGLQAWYTTSGLAAMEWPHYLRHLDERGDADAAAKAREWPEKARDGLLLQHRLADARAEAALAGALASTGEAEAQARALQAEFQRRAAGLFTHRYTLRYSAIEPVRMVSHAFLHGGIGHLLGNMFFLVALGLLVEGALGEWRFAGLYLAGTLGAAAFALAWRWGQAGAALGASGAVSALMGAFCVLWGRRPVRFFWWFLVVFDYVRKPAIWLLPAWIGWEALHLWLDPDAGIGFDAHLGGLLAGAAVGGLLVLSGQVRTDFLEDRDETPAETLAAALAEVRPLLGSLQLDRAAALLEGLAARHPASLEVALLRYRAARLGNHAVAARQHALAALALPAADADDVAAQHALLDEALPAPRLLPPGPWLDALWRRWLLLGEHARVEALLKRSPSAIASPAAWFELALAWRDREPAEAQRVLALVARRFPGSAEAGKARFLLASEPAPA